MASQLAKRIAERVLGLGDLKPSISGTYFVLRWTLVLIAFLLPLHFVLLGNWAWGVPVQNSLSDYYNAQNGALRDWFVGYLWVVGFLLVVYRGFTWRENWALNLAGASLIVVAMVPTGTSSLHGVAAIAFFVLVAYVVKFRARDTVTDYLIRSSTRLTFYRWAYPALSVAMIIFVFLTVLVSFAVNPNKFILLLESAGVWAFGVYWCVKSVELQESAAESKAAEGKMVRSADSGSRLRQTFSQARFELHDP